MAKNKNRKRTSAKVSRRKELLKKRVKERRRRKMKSILIPETVLIYPGGAGTEDENRVPPSKYTFKQFLKAAVNGNKEFGTGIENMKNGFDLIKLIKERCGDVGTMMTIENEDYNRFKRSIDACEWNASIVLQLETFITAIESAIDPEEEKKKKEKEKEEKNSKAGKKK